MGEGRWGKFYFCIFLSKSTPFNSVYIFIFFMYCQTTEVSSMVRRWFFNGSTIQLVHGSLKRGNNG